jgi:hypothetical protein
MNTPHTGVAVSASTETTPATAPTGTGEVAPTSLWSRWLPPLLAYLATHLWYAIAAFGHGADWLSVDSRMRWDAGLYAGIAREGYQLVRCTKIGYSTDPNAWCGDAGWFPLYPYVVRLLTRITGLSAETCGVVAAELCALAMLVLVWRLLGARVNVRTVACLAAAAALPAGIYFHAVFPMSMAVLLALATFVLLERGRWGTAAIVGALTATVYPIAVLLAPAAVVHVLARTGAPLRQRLVRAACVGGFTVTGTLAVFTLLWATTGRFDAYFLVQEKYSHGLHDPLQTYLLLTLTHYPTVNIYASPEMFDRVATAVGIELVFSTALVLLSLVAVGIATWRSRATPLDWALALYGPLLLVVPLVVGVNVSQYRSHTLLLPIVLVLRHLPAPVTAVLAAVAMPLGYVMSTLFLMAMVV